EMANFWTGHSARHVATSLAAALGVSKDRRDYLGRWAYAQHGSQDYVLTSRQVVQGVQNFICKCLIMGHTDGGYTEEELFCTMRSYAEALHLAGDEIVKACSVLQWDDVGATWKLGGNFPSFAVSPDRVRAAAGNMGADLPGPYQDFEQEEDRDDAPYFITISRKGFRRLHLSKKCAVRRENCLETLPIFKLSEGHSGGKSGGTGGIVCKFAIAAGGVQPESEELSCGWSAAEGPQRARASMATNLPAGVDQAAALNHLDKNVSSDLVHIFQECGVPLGLQYRLTLNFQSVKRFSTYADSRADVRTALKDDHTLEATDQATRAAVASVVSAWETAKEYASKESELRAEARMLGVSRPVSQTEKQAMRAAYEAAHGNLEEAFEPSDDYISAKLEEIENGEISASALSEVTSKKRVRTMGIQTTVDTGGHVRIVKQRNKGVMPQHTEELRTVLRVEGNAWTMLASKFKNKVFFADMSPDAWLAYANYLLGNFDIVHECLTECATRMGIQLKVDHLCEAGIGWSLVHPEDLGKLRSLEDPASIWQWSELRGLMNYSGPPLMNQELANMLLCSTCDHRSTDGSFQGDQAFFGPLQRSSEELHCFPKVFSSLGVFLNVQAEMHKDSRNGSHPNLLLALSSFTNGQVWTEDAAGTIFREVRGVFKPGRLLPVADSPQRLMAHQCYHQTEPWTGERLLLVGFTISDALQLESSHLATLRDLGFVLPASSHLKGGDALDEDGQEPPLSTPRDAAASGAPADLSTPSGGSTRVAHVSAPTEGPTLSASPSAVSPLEQTLQEDVEEADDSGDFDPNTSRCRGRWRPLARNALASSGEWDHAGKIRKVLAEAVHQAIPDLRKAAFALATGRLIKSPFSEKLINDVRARMAATLPDPEQALCKPDGQPFMLHMLSQSLKILGDPDYEILDQGNESFAEGVPLGWDKPIARTPQVFPKRTHFRKLDESDFDPSMVNYRSAEMNAAQLEEKFRQDEQAGMMLCTTEPEARRKYGSEAVLIAAMGAVTKANGDVRPLHDGTHGINLNNSIVILDKLQVPGPEDLQEVASRVKESKEAPFSLCADISHAHRNVKVRECDWPRLACKSSSASRVLWLNKVGTFGVSSAAYYWT
ncbi:unnamed protein product, partial [Symbiodinium necroappetens]